MRYDDGLTYEEYKEAVIGAMNHMVYSNWSAENVTNWMAEEDDDMLIEDSTSLALWIISIAEYEIRHDILEKRVHDQLCYHIPRFQEGAYVEDLSEEELDQVKKDVEYILSKVEMYKVVPKDDDEE